MANFCKKIAVKIFILQFWQLWVFWTLFPRTQDGEVKIKCSSQQFQTCLFPHLSASISELWMSEIKFSTSNGQSQSRFKCIFKHNVHVVQYNNAIIGKKGEEGRVTNCLTSSKASPILLPTSVRPIFKSKRSVVESLTLWHLRFIKSNDRQRLETNDVKSISLTIEYHRPEGKQKGESFTCDRNKYCIFYSSTCSSE